MGDGVPRVQVSTTYVRGNFIWIERTSEVNGGKPWTG